jgi:hypothetical protein
MIKAVYLENSAESTEGIGKTRAALLHNQFYCYPPHKQIEEVHSSDESKFHLDK